MAHDLNLMFEGQLRTLFERLEAVFDSGYSRRIVDELQKQRLPVLLKAAELDSANNGTLFVPVLSFSEVLTPDAMMRMVWHGSRIGYSYLSIIDTASFGANKRPPYYIFGVDDGTLTAGMAYDKASNFLRKQDRKFLRPQELVSLAIHKSVFLEHNLIAGELNGNGHYTDLWMDAGAPSFSLIPKSASHPKWKYPSCLIR